MAGRSLYCRIRQTPARLFMLEFWSVDPDADGNLSKTMFKEEGAFFEEAEARRAAGGLPVHI